MPGPTNLKSQIENEGVAPLAHDLRAYSVANACEAVSVARRSTAWSRRANSLRENSEVGL